MEAELEDSSSHQNKGCVTSHSPLQTLYIMGVHAYFKQALQAYEFRETIICHWKIVTHHQAKCKSIIVVDLHFFKSLTHGNCLELICW